MSLPTVRPASPMRLLRDRAGLAALEFALVAPVLILMLTGTADLGMQIYTRMQLEAAVDAGANYAIVNNSKVDSSDGSALASAIATLVANANGGASVTATVVVNNGPSATASGSSTTTSGTASSADDCYCPTGSGPTWTWGSATSCGGTCAGGGLAGKFVAVTASYAYAPIVSGFGFTSAGTIAVSTMVQTQ